MKKYFLDSYETLIGEMRSTSEPLTPKIKASIDRFLMEAEAHIEAQVSLLDQVNYWRGAIEREARGCQAFKQTVELERDHHGKNLTDSK